MPRILLCHPGHSFSTSDVYDGLKVGLEAAGAEVVEFRWGNILRTLNGLVMGGVASEAITPEQGQHLYGFVSFLSAADIVSTAVEQEVDAALVVNGLLLPPNRAAILSKIVPIGCYGTEAPYFLEAERAIAPAYTHWFTQERRSVPFFADLLAPERSHYLPMAYNPEVHVPGPASPDHACDVVFVGGGYPERRALLDGADWTGVNFVRKGTLWDIDLDEERAKGIQPGQGSKYSKGAIPNTETTLWHQNALISLNLHRHMTYVETGGSIDPSTAESLGPRAYEIPAVGGFMLCDDERPELLDVYGDAAATFKAGDSADLRRQVDYWLSHPDQRDRQRQAQAEAVAPHTWTARARTVLETLLA